jgi:predicted transcriptional regulator
MKPGNSGIVLLYNCTGPEFSKLRQIFAMLRLKMRPVSPDRYHLPLKDLAFGKGEAAEQAEEPLPERMLVFCGLNQVFLQQVLEVIRLAKLPPIPMKAVLTNTNMDWDTHQLYEELLKEREAIVAGQKEAKEQQERTQKPEEAQPQAQNQAQK